MAADLDFFFDPVCPWAWITSRWVVDVSEQREYEVDWRFISLWILNENNTQEWYTPDYRAGHHRGHQGLRIADAIRLGESDPAAVGRWYTALGTAIHVTLQVSFPMPNIHIMIKLPHAKKGWSISERKGNRNSIPENPGGQRFIDSGILPFQQKRNVLPVMD